MSSSIPIEELIARYNREIMELQEKNAATISDKQQEKPLTVADLDEKYPLPNVADDLQSIQSSAIPTMATVTSQAAEDNAVENESEGSTNQPPSVSPPKNPENENQLPATEENTTILPPSSPPPTEMSVGYLRVFVTTGNGTLPIPNAQVIVTRIINDEELLEQAARTDNSGYTPMFILPAVSGKYSQKPGNPSPYTFYTIYVRANGFYPTKINEIPLYGGITAMQPIDLIPVAEGDNPNRERTITEGAPENLL